MKGESVMKHISRFLLLVFWVFTITNPTLAQWVQTNGPTDGTISCFGTADSLLYASPVMGIFCSSDHGVSWSTSGLSSNRVYAILQFDGMLFATGDAVFRSTDNGKTWRESADVSTGIWVDGAHSLVAADHVLFAGVPSDNLGVYRTFDDGVTWQPCDTGLTDRNIHVMATCGNVILAGTWTSGIFRSTDTGSTWSPANTGFSDPNVSAFAVWDSLMFVSSWDGHLFVSPDSGATWTPAGMGFKGGISALAIQPDAGEGGAIRLFAALQCGGIFRSTDNGITWNPSGTGVTDPCVQSFAVVPAGDGSGGTILLAATQTGGAFCSTDYGETWSKMIIPITWVYHLGTTQNSLFAAAALSGGGIYRTTDNGATWGLSGYPGGSMTCFATMGRYLFAGGNRDSVVRTSDEGVTWESHQVPTWNVWSLAVSADGSGKLFAAMRGAGGPGFQGSLAFSSDSGVTWTPIDWDPPDSIIMTLAAAPGSTPGTGYIFAVSEAYGIYRSSNNGATWTVVNDGLPSWPSVVPGQRTKYFVQSLCVVPYVSGSCMFAGTGAYETTGLGICMSTDYGNTWKPVAPPYCQARSFAVSPNGSGGTYVFALTGENGILASTDCGTSWAWINPGLNCDHVEALTVFDQAGDMNLYAGTRLAGVWKYPLSRLMSSDTSWNGVAPGMGSAYISSIVFSPAGDGTQRSNIFAVSAQDLPNASGGDLFRSTDDGRNLGGRRVGAESHRHVSHDHPRGRRAGTNESPRGDLWQRSRALDRQRSILVESAVPNAPSAA